MQPQEPHRYENPIQPQYVRPRTKLGLETPLVGRFWGENKRLIIAPPIWYDTFVILVVLVGLWMLGVGLFGTPSFQDGTWFTWVGTAVFAAGILGALSSERMVMDLRQRTYWRREGQGPFKRFTRGSLNEIDAIVLQAGESLTPTLGGRTVIYRICFFWKGNKEPVFIADRDRVVLPMGSMMNAKAGPLLQRASRYSKEAQIPVFDNSYFSSPDPLRLI